jgi:hypothetical protein
MVPPAPQEDWRHARSCPCFEGNGCSVTAGGRGAPCWRATECQQRRQRGEKVRRKYRKYRKFLCRTPARPNHQQFQAFRWIRRHPVCAGWAWRKPAEIGGNWRKLLAENSRQKLSASFSFASAVDARKAWKTACGNCGKCGNSPNRSQGHRLCNFRHLKRGPLDFVRGEQRSKRTQGIGVCSCSLSTIHCRGARIP